MEKFESKFVKKELSHKVENNVFSVEQEVFLKSELEKMKDDTLLEEDFRGKISNEIIDKCLKEVKDYEKLFIQKNKINEIKDKINEKENQSPEYKKVSEYLEALFYNKLGGEKGWIPGSVVWKTSKYDDIKGIDFIVENNKREFSLNTDVTFSGNKGLIRKLNGLRHQIEIGEFTQPIFYESENENIGYMPKVIIAVEREKIIKALKLWADGQGDLLNEHPIMIKTLLEVEAQLEAYAYYSKANKKRGIAASCNDVLAQIQRLITEHENIKEKYQNIIEDDEAYKTIISFCEKLKNEADRIIKQE